MRHRFGPVNVPPDDLASYLLSLHLEDLSLACACRDGDEQAWDYLVQHVFPAIRAAAGATMGGDADAAAGTLLGDLYGTKSRDGRRVSLLDYFHGRSRLTTWLKVVLAQRRVDAHRASVRLVPLERAGDGEPSRAAIPTRPEHADVDAQNARRVDRPKILGAFEDALHLAAGELEADDRLRLALYYRHGATLSQIGRALGEHESSVSRKLDRARRQIRQQVETALKAQGFGEEDLRQCYDEAPASGALDLASLLGEGKTP
ncbi:MAG: sigma factor-like helix-turn-helix DNA-binding protein [Vicinamibacterales bacterium]